MDETSSLKVINMEKWLQENEKFLLPPVCNKLMHNTQLKIMYVGGPNSRRDYHIEEGEELFYMIKGDMCLKVVEQGRHRDIEIKEGELFLLPAYIPHSPQRQKDTIGLVIERERQQNEFDILRYYTKDLNQILFEKKFYCKNLATQLPAIMKEFFNSEPYKSEESNPEFILDLLPFDLGNKTSLMKPFYLQSVLADSNDKYFQLFCDKYQSQVDYVTQQAQFEVYTDEIEHWIWQLVGSSSIYAGDDKWTLNTGDTILLPSRVRYIWKTSATSKAFRIFQNGSRKSIQY